MIYDCFLFNDELDLLELRLKFLDKSVDKFVLVESARTLSGQAKPLHFRENRQRYAAYLSKIIPLEAPVNDMPPWDYEIFQRNYCKQGLQDCQADDIIFISDADEILNIPAIISLPKVSLPSVIELPVYYYFMSNKTSSSFFVNLAAPWSFIRDEDIGIRYKKYHELCSHTISKEQVLTGWHFSYLFGYDITKYQEKIRSFSHQEYNTPYWLNPDRIRRCIRFDIDLFERAEIRMENNQQGLAALLPFIQGTSLQKLVNKPDLKIKSPVRNFFFILHKKYINRVRYRLQSLFREKAC